MNKNKGFIGIGLIIAIVLGIAVVGGGAYSYIKYENKWRESPPLPFGENNEVKNPENILPNNQNQNSTNVSVNLNNKIITVLSPNGGEVYKDTDKITIKWKGTGKDRVALSLRFFDGGWCSIKDLPSNITSYVFTPYGNDCGDGRIINSGKYKVTLIAYENGGMAPEPGTAFAGDYSDNDGSGNGFSIDSSDNYFTINSEKYQTSPELFSSNITCNKDNPNYFVVSKSLTSETGTDILIKYKNSNKNITCDYKVEGTDFEIKDNGNSEYFYAISKNLLILDSGTGPSNRGIIIYNLDSRKKVFNDIYNPDGVSNIIVDTEKNTMTYWSPNLNQPVTKQNCSLAQNSLNRVIVSHIFLDLSTLVKKDLGENKCVYSQ